MIENTDQEPKPEDDVGLSNDKQMIIKLPYPPPNKNFYEDNSDSGFEIGFIPNFFDF